MTDWVIPSNAQNFVYRSKCTRIPLSFRWEIEEFVECLPTVGSQYFSPDFELDNGTRLYVGLERQRLDNEEWFSVSLWHSLENVKKTTLSFSIALLRTPSKEDYRKTVKSHQFLSSLNENSYKFPKFLRFSELTDPAQGFLMDGHMLTVLVEGSVFDGRALDESKINLTRIRSINANLDVNFCKHISGNIRKMFDEGILTDFVVKARDSEGKMKELKVHRTIMGAASDELLVFLAMLSNSKLKECQVGQVEIDDIQFEVMEALVRFFYTGELPSVTPDKKGKGVELLDLLVAADKYQIDGLKRLVERRLAESISIENVCELFAEADLLKAHQLKAQCADFIRQQHKMVVKTEGWNSMSPRLMAYLFHRGDQDIGGDGEAQEAEKPSTYTAESSTATNGGSGRKRRRRQ